MKTRKTQDCNQLKRARKLPQLLLAVKSILKVTFLKLFMLAGEIRDNYIKMLNVNTERYVRFRKRFRSST